MAAPPAVVVITATRGVRRSREGATRLSKGRPSIKAERLSTRAMPQSRKNASATSSSPASAPVWVSASSRAATERPSL